MRSFLRRWRVPPLSSSVTATAMLRCISQQPHLRDSFLHFHRIPPAASSSSPAPSLAEDMTVDQAELRVVADIAALLVEATSAAALGVPITTLTRAASDEALDLLGDEDVSLKDVVAAHPGLFETSMHPANGKLLVAPRAASAAGVAVALVAGAGLLSPPKEAFLRAELVWVFVLADLRSAAAGAVELTVDPGQWSAEAVVKRATKRVNRSLQDLLQDRFLAPTPGAATGSDVAEALARCPDITRAVLRTAADAAMPAAAGGGALLTRVLPSVAACFSALTAAVEAKPVGMLEVLRVRESSPDTAFGVGPSTIANVLPPSMPVPVIGVRPDAPGANGDAEDDAAAKTDAIRTADRRLATAAVLASLPQELVPVDPDTVRTLVRRLQAMAERCAEASPGAGEVLEPLLAHVHQMAAANDRGGSIEADPVAAVDTLQSALATVFDEGVLDVVTVQGHWMPKPDPPVPPTAHLGGGFASAADPAAAPEPNVPGGNPEFDDVLSARKESAGSPEREWLHRSAAPQKVLLEPFSLYCVGDAAASSALQAWAGSYVKATVPEETLTTAADVESLVDMRPAGRRAFFRLLPPFHATQLQMMAEFGLVMTPLPPDAVTIDDQQQQQSRDAASAVAAEAHEAWDPHVAQEHDILRLARTISAVELTPLLELVRRGVCGILGTLDLQLLALSRPSMFEFVPPPPHDGDGGATSVETRHGGRVRFLVADRHLCKLKPATPQELQHAMQSLRDERRSAPKHKRYRVTRKIIDLKNRLVHAEHPAPHPLMDPEVLALFIFDVLPVDGGPVEVDTLYAIMPRAARLGPTQTSAFYRRYPHLFHIFEMGQDPVKVFIQRADGPRPSEVDPDDLTEQDIMEAVLSPFRFAAREDRCTQLGFVTGRLVASFRTAIEKRHGSLQGYVEAHPQVFEMRPDEQSMGATARVKPSAVAAITKVVSKV